MLDRESFLEQLEHEVARARRNRRRLSVLVGQLGDPRQHDFVGRAAGALVDHAGAVLTEQKRQVDMVASLGQGSFGLILPETGEPGALAVAERLQATVASALGVSAPKISFGVATLGRHGAKPAALLRAAQRAATVGDLVLIDRPVAAG
jgi:diguanylate cyclase (GGDEF)-like protein